MSPSQDRSPYQNPYDKGHYDSQDSSDYEQIRACVASPHVP